MKTLAELQALAQTEAGKDQLRVMLAELLGYHRDQTTGMWENSDKRFRRVAYSLPDYPRDLNACHEVERMLTEDQTDAFRQTLMDSMLTHKEPCGFSDAISATATDRTIALILTLQTP